MSALACRDIKIGWANHHHVRLRRRLVLLDDHPDDYYHHTDHDREGNHADPDVHEAHVGWNVADVAAKGSGLPIHMR